jgi:hypothetical protein
MIVGNRHTKDGCWHTSAGTWSQNLTKRAGKRHRISLDMAAIFRVPLGEGEVRREASLPPLRTAANKLDRRKTIASRFYQLVKPSSKSWTGRRRQLLVVEPRATYGETNFLCTFVLGRAHHGWGKPHQLVTARRRCLVYLCHGRKAAA